MLRKTLKPKLIFKIKKILLGHSSQHHKSQWKRKDNFNPLDVKENEDINNLFFDKLDVNDNTDIWDSTHDKLEDTKGITNPNDDADKTYFTLV